MPDPRDPDERPKPPAPPRPEWIKPPASAPPPASGAPVMDFFQRRLEAMERELAMERERASSAQALLAQQDALRAEVDSHLKALTEQLRREKAERDSDEAKSRAHGRVDALERRLDEMHATFAGLLKEAIARAGAGGPIVESLGAELAIFRRSLKDVGEQVARWRDDMKDLPGLLPEVRSLASRLPQDEERFESHIARRLDEFAARVDATLSDWERSRREESRRQAEGLELLARERADLARAWEEQSHSIRSEHLKERLAREAALTDQIASLASRVEALGEGRKTADAGLRETLERIASSLAASPKAKDEIIALLEQEKEDLRRALRDRNDALRRYSEERRAVEKSLGDSLVAAHAETDAERLRTRAAEASAVEARGRAAELEARIADLERSLAERERRLESLAAERDQLARALVAESEKVRAGLAARAEGESAWHKRASELQAALERASEAARAEASAAQDLRAKLATLGEQMARAFQERDQTMARFADWDHERRRLLDALRQKDEMISMLNSAFQSSLGK